jgi:hypothetical protein
MNRDRDGLQDDKKQSKDGEKEKPRSKKPP